MCDGPPMRPGLLLLSCAVALAACGGSGATVPAVSELTEARDAGSVAPGEAAEPVTPGTRFECTTSRALADGSIHSIAFLLRDGELVEPLDESPAFEVKPETSELARLDEDTETEHEGGKLVFRGDDGATELALFDNSGLTRGYVRGKESYSEIYCAKDR